MDIAAKIGSSKCWFSRTSTTNPGGDDADDEVESEVEGGKEVAALETEELSLNSMVGFTPLQTMKVRGKPRRIRGNCLNRLGHKPQFHLD